MSREDVVRPLPGRIVRSALVLLLVTAAPGFASGGGPAPLEAQVQEEVLRSEVAVTAARFAGHWAAGEVDALAGILAPDGIRLHLEGPARSSIPRRQAVAAIRDFLRSFEEGQTRVIRASEVEGSERRGFVEIRWAARVAGTSHTVEHTLFLSLVRPQERWQVEELRLLR